MDPEAIDWDSFRDVRVLSSDAHAKSIAVLGICTSAAHPAGAPTLVIAQRHGFDGAADVLAALRARTGPADMRMAVLSENDVYRYCALEALPAQGPALPVARFTAVHPASERHIAKYSSQSRVLVRESPEDYAAVTRPYIESLAAPAWVGNLLSDVRARRPLPPGELLVHAEHLDDAARGFAVFADSKWDRRDMRSLYMLVLPVRADVRSLRDLDATHLPLLEGIHAAVSGAVPAAVARGVLGAVPAEALGARNLRCFVHYQPTYYHLHVHVVHADHELPGMAVGASHLLDDIIENIRAVQRDYYQRRTLTYSVPSTHPLAR